MQSQRPTRAEVNISKILHNYREIRNHLHPGTKIMAVVKADAYGHGVLPVARALESEGAERLAVAIVDEGVELRQAGIASPIQILGLTLKEELSALFDYNLIPTISRLDEAVLLSSEAKKREREIRVHLKLDTGMGRIGCLRENLPGLLQELKTLPHLKLEGVMTHFAAADEGDKAFTHKQWKKFQASLALFKAAGLKPPSLLHAANSATILDLTDYQLQMVRPGLILYGLWPSDQVCQQLDLKPALRWRTEVVHLKWVEAGTPISYGCTYLTEKRTRVATLPLGYADGYDRLLSTRGEVLVNGLRAPVIGRVCMDQIMIDVTDISGVEIGSEALLIGQQGDDEISAAEMAGWLKTINYEVVTRIGKRVPRIYIEEKG